MGVGILLSGQASAEESLGDKVLRSIMHYFSAPNEVCLGNGAGGFVCSEMNGGARSSIDVGLGDVNGDGNLDAVFANSDGTNQVCLGNGAGGFSCSDVSADKSTSEPDTRAKAGPFYVAYWPQMVVFPGIPRPSDSQQRVSARGSLLY